MKEELEKKKKIKKLAEAAGAGGIKNAVSDETKNKIVSGVKKVAQKVSEVAKPTVGSMAKDLINKKKENKIKSRKDKNTIDYKYAYQKDIQPGGKYFKDANAENQLYKRYEKVGVSPIFGHDGFNHTSFGGNSKELDEKLGNRLTEDDKVVEKSKKRNKSQY